MGLTVLDGRQCGLASVDAASERMSDTERGHCPDLSSGAAIRFAESWWDGMRLGRRLFSEPLTCAELLAVPTHNGRVGIAFRSFVSGLGNDEQSAPNRARGGHNQEI
jgi:hypothetical protein